MTNEHMVAMQCTIKPRGSILRSSEGAWLITTDANMRDRVSQLALGSSQKLPDYKGCQVGRETSNQNKQLGLVTQTLLSNIVLEQWFSNIFMPRSRTPNFYNLLYRKKSLKINRSGNTGQCSSHKSSLSSPNNFA